MRNPAKRRPRASSADVTALLSGGAAERAGGGTTEPSDDLLLALRHAANEAPHGHAVTLESARDEIIDLRAALTAERAHRAQAEAERDALVAGIRRVLDCPCLSGASCDELDTLRATLADDTTGGTHG